MSTQAGCGRLVFFLCDVQERFRPLIHRFGDVAAVAETMARASALLGVPLVVTEQYPKALLRTVPEVSAALRDGSGALLPGVALFEKSSFSMMTTGVNLHLLAAAPDYETAVLFGIEAHVCVQQTCLDLLAQRKRVLLLVDGISSQARGDREVALAHMLARGAEATTTGSLLFQLLRTAEHPSFKPVSQLVKELLAKGTELALR